MLIYRCTFGRVDILFKKQKPHLSTARNVGFLLAGEVGLDGRVNPDLDLSPIVDVLATD
jgi:hypothetical protein